MTGPRDWDKEMAEIDKIIASGKAVPATPNVPATNAPAPLGARAGVPTANAPRTVTRKRDTAAVWFRVVLGAAAAVALPFWPYNRACGTMLYAYLLGGVAIAAAGIWAMRGAWVHRRGVAHVFGVLILMAGVALVALEVLHRTGFATVRLGWLCP